MKTKSNTKIDMTTGPIMKNIFIFAIPIILSSVLQNLYSTVDTLIVGNFCGETSLAAIGTSAQPIEVVLCVFLGIGGGVSILISQATGARDNNTITKLCRTAVTFVYIVGIPLSLIGMFLTPFILTWMGVPDDTFPIAVAYTRISFAGTLANIGYNMNAGILRGMGDSSASLNFLIISCCTNIVLDILFVPVFGLEAPGAALATVIAQYTAWLFSVYYTRKHFKETGFTFLPKGCSWDAMKNIIIFGIPIGLNNSLFSLGHLFMQSFINAQGSTFMAANAVAGRVSGLANIAISALSSAGATFSGQNFGAKNIERIRQGYIKIPAVSGAITIAFGLFFITLRMPIIRFFTKDEMVIFYASRFIIVSLSGQWMFAVYNSIANIVNGTGNLKYTTTVNLLMLWAVRIPTAYIISKYFDGTWVMLSILFSFIFGMLSMIGYYMFSKKWKNLINER